MNGGLHFWNPPSFVRLLFYSPFCFDGQITKSTGDGLREHKLFIRRVCSTAAWVFCVQRCGKQGQGLVRPGG